jgi:hypothetical protein
LADEQGIAGAEDVVGRGVELGQRDHERGCVLAPVRPRVGRVEHVEDHGHLGAGLCDLGVSLLEHDAAEALGEPAHPLADHLAAPRERARDHAAPVRDRDATNSRAHEDPVPGRVMPEDRSWVVMLASGT